MATIFTPQMAQQQTPQPAQAPSSNNSDPLFDALVKYITSTPGATSTTSDQLEAIINEHSNVAGGRAYLESLVAPDPTADSRVWLKSAPANGFVSTNMDRLTLNFTASAPAYIAGNGTANGFFGPQVTQFQMATFLWDELSSSGPIKTNFEIIVLPQLRQAIVNFYPEVTSPEDRKAIAELIIYESSLRLPPHGVKGLTTLVPMFHTQ